MSNRPFYLFLCDLDGFLGEFQQKMTTAEEKVNRKMHELFMQVLKNRDLSRAGDLFSVPDAAIVNDLTNVVSYFIYKKVSLPNLFNREKNLIVKSVAYLF